MPSPLFMAGIDARAALEVLDGKLRNASPRRPITKSERYAVAIALDAADGIAERLARATVKPDPEVL